MAFHKCLATLSDRDINKHSKEVMEQETMVTMSALSPPLSALPTDFKGQENVEQCPCPKKNKKGRLKKFSYQ